MKTPLPYASLLCLLACGIAGYGQQATVVPFELAGKLILVPATVDDQPGHFILDTGVQHLMLNSHYFASDSRSKIMHGIFGAAGQLGTRYSDLRLAGLHFSEVYAETISLQHLERAKGIIIHGLIGTSLLREFEVLIDLSDQLLTLLPTDQRGWTGYGYPIPPSDTIGFRWKGDLPCVTAQVGNNRLNLLLDTGAEIGLLNANLDRRMADYLVPQQKTAANVISFTPDKQRLRVSLLQQLRVDDLSCAPVRVVFGSMRIFNDRLPGPFLDGLIGYHALTAHQLAINFKQRTIYLWPEEKELERPLLVRHF